MMTDEEVAWYWAHVARLATVYRMTWRTPEHGIVESQRLIGQNAVVAKVNRVQPSWYTVEEWCGHDTGWVRLGTMVRSRAGKYKHRRVN
jgi:hypothetical protein